jgi:acyl-CoA synthetase (AMP-forming)/AMP-acid ligase II
VRSFPDVLRSRARLYPDKVAFIYLEHGEEQRVTQLASIEFTRHTMEGINEYHKDESLGDFKGK